MRIIYGVCKMVVGYYSQLPFLNEHLKKFMQGLTQANETYIGDALLQKTYTVDFLTKKKVMNRGIVPQYYIEDDHEAIIPKELFHRVQEEKARRASIYRPASGKKGAEVKGKYSAKYALSDIMVCAECGQSYRNRSGRNTDRNEPCGTVTTV